jgi:ATP-dependent DNA ligase
VLSARIIAKSIKASTAVIDGEIVALDENGVQCFEQLQNHTRHCAILYFAIDLLFLDGESLTNVPLIERKAQLKRILPKSLSGRLRFTDHVVERGLDLIAALEAQQLEGMVAKRADSLYVSGKIEGLAKGQDTRWQGNHDKTDGEPGTSLNAWPKWRGASAEGEHLNGHQHK